MDEILIHVSSEIVFSFLKNHKRNPVFKRTCNNLAVFWPTMDLAEI